MVTESYAALLLVYAGAEMGGFMMSSQDTVLEFGHREQLPMKIAFAKSAAKATAELGFAIGSFIVAIGGFLGLFWVRSCVRRYL